MLSITINEVFREHRLEPIVISIVGPNGSGKSSAAVAIGIADPGEGFDPGHIRLDHESGKVYIRFVNPDDFSAQIREAKPGLTQEQSDRVAAEIAKRRRRELAEARIDFGFETVGSHESKPKFLRELKEAGYYVVVLFVGTEDPEINKRRVKQRVAAGGHDVDPEKVESRYGRTMGFLVDYYDVADYIAIYDNSLEVADEGQPRLLVTKDSDGEMQVTEFCGEVRWIHKYLLDLV